MKLAVLFGTRPEAIKLCPVVRAMRERGLSVPLIHSGQHRELCDGILPLFGLRADRCLHTAVAGGTLVGFAANLFTALPPILEEEKPDALLVHGDTATAAIGAMAAFYMGIPVFHVEAGLRTYDTSDPYPEEANRRMIAGAATLHFAPTEAAKDNLLREGVPGEDIYVTGNTGIDALRYTVQDTFSHPLLEEAKNKPLFLLTAHRRESRGERLAAMLRGIRRAIEGQDVLVLFPVHPAVQETAEAVLARCPEIRLMPPLSPDVFQNLLARCAAVLTDSGGIQEEAAALGIPALVLREHTERGEGVAAGGLCLTGRGEEEIFAAVSAILANPCVLASMRGCPNPFGDGRASEKIAAAITAWCTERAAKGAF